jgi:hypothetical protein
MRKNIGFAARIAGATGLAILLGSSVYAAPQDYHGDHRDQRRDERTDYRGDRISTQGHIRDIRREGDRYRITVDRGSYPDYVSADTFRDRQLRVGLDVRLGGFVVGNAVNVDLVAFNGEPTYTADPNYRAVPFGSTGWMSGVVERVDRHLGYLAIRDDATGQIVKIDVRHMNIRRPVNVWGARTGDHVTINGSWENRETFDARRVEF